MIYCIFIPIAFMLLASVLMLVWYSGVVPPKKRVLERVVGSAGSQPTPCEPIIIEYFEAGANLTTSFSIAVNPCSVVYEVLFCGVYCFNIFFINSPL